MGGAIADAEVGFHLDDAAGGGAVHQDLAEAIARDFDGRARVEIAGESRPNPPEFARLKCGLLPVC